MIKHHAAARRHRVDIEGMRGLAVLAVIVFHINVDWLRGGFLGVDVFLVLSGFLITGNLLAELDHSGRIDFGAFYTARVRRIAPTAFACTLACLVAALVAFSPADVVAAARSALAAAFSFTNVYETYFVYHGYFASASAQNPFLHMWSLAVEEQFYLGWPVVLALVMARAGRHAVTLFAGASALSFVWSYVWPSYMMLHARVGELLMGAVLAVWVAKRPVHMTSLAADVTGVWGLALVVGSMFVVSKADVIPGFASLPACVGTVMLLVAGHVRPACPSSTLLSVEPLALLGRVSYSAYLWHWPVLALMRYLALPLVGWHYVTCVAYMVVLTLASYTLLEVRFRRVEWSTARVVLFLFVLPLVVVVCVSGATLRGARLDPAIASATPPPSGSPTATTGTTLQVSHAFRHDPSCRLPYTNHSARSPWERLNWAAVQHLGFDRWTGCSKETPNVCFIDNWSDDVGGCVKHDFSNCYGGDLSAPCDDNAIGVFGDSGAAEHFGMLDVFGRAAGFRFYHYTVGLCPFFYWPGIQENPNPSRDYCLRRNLMAGKMLERFRGRTIVWGGFWRVFTHFNSKERLEYFFKKTMAHILSLNIRVIFLGTPPTMPTFPNNCPFIEPINPQDPWHWCSQFFYSLKCLQLRDYHKELRTWTRHPLVEWWEVSAVLCPQGVCAPYVDGVKVYVDIDHLSFAASRALGLRIVDTMGVPDVFIEARDRECRPRTGAHVLIATTPNDHYNHIVSD